MSALCMHQVNSVVAKFEWCVHTRAYSISQEICTRFLLCCALLWLYIDWFSHIHQAYFTGTVAIVHWHCGNLTIAPVPAKQPWWIWINTSCEFIMNDCLTTTKQSTIKPCAYFLGYTVHADLILITVQPKQHRCHLLMIFENTFFVSKLYFKANFSANWSQCIM